MYGNATNDDYLDNRDLEFIESIVNGDVEWDRSTNPYADANFDGKVDSKDIDFVKRMINREEMKIFFVDGGDVVQEINYPLKHIGVIGNTQLIRVQALGILDKVVGISGTRLSFDDVLHSTLDKLPRISKSTASIDIPMYSNVAQSVPGGIDAVLVAGNSWSKSKASLDEAGITTVRMDSTNVPSEFRTYLTFGYLVQAEERSHQIVDYMDDFFKNLDSTLNKIPESEKKTAVLISGVATGISGGAMCSPSSLYFDRLIYAGAICNITDDDLAVQSGIGDGDVWHLSEKFQSDYLIQFCSGFGYQSTLDDFVEFWKVVPTNPAYSLYEMDAYPDGYACISRDTISIIQIAYCAEFFYPDYFEKGFGDRIHQEWIDLFFDDLDGYVVTDHITFFTIDDVKDCL